MTDAPKLSIDPELIAQMQFQIWRTDNRARAIELGIDPENVERSVFVLWRLNRLGGIVHQVRSEGKDG